MVRKKGAPDILIFFATMLLLAVGIIMVFSASYYETLEADPFYYLRRQLLWGLLGVVSMIITSKIDYFRWKKLIWPAFIGAFILLVLVIIPGVGYEVKNATRWLDLGFTKLQPSELMKLAVVFFIAKIISEKGFKSNSFIFGLGPYLLLIGAIGGLIMLEPDLGTTIAISGTIFVMLFAAGLRWRHIFFCITAAIGVVAALIIEEPYRWNRIVGFLDPWSHADREGYQIINALYALGSGGFFGMGLGNSRQKLAFLPEQYTDFIFAILAEELGFIGSFFVLVLFFVIAWRGYRVALRCPDMFGSLLAVGLTTTIVLQAVMNIAVVTGVMPVTGIALPFISYGGSSLLISMTVIGILLNISRYAKAN
ncbi:MAG: putative lipid II flippase FtsW [Peptococcia bacterium]